VPYTLAGSAARLPARPPSRAQSRRARLPADVPSSLGRGSARSSGQNLPDPVHPARCLGVGTQWGGSTRT
jgi:hypothetical protein